MCDQTEVIYAPGDVVWVKLGPVWWPSQVQDYDKLPEDITANLRKRPIAVVKFFQEDAFEYVKNLDQIYHYNCRRKHEFIKKGIDMCRSSNRNVPSNMKMFPNDIATAEHLTNGDPNILSDPQFEPEEKKDYRELFGKKPAKKSKLDHSKEWRIRSFGESPLKSAARNGRQSLPTTPRPVTHPRFINKALGKGSDHEVRIRSQGNDLQSSGKLYNCHLCGFSASRINVIILHNKSHSAGYADAYLPSTPSSGSKGKKRSLKEKQPRTSLLVDRVRNDEPPVKRKTLGGSADNKSPAQSSGKSQKEGKDSNTASADATVKSVSSSSPVRKPIFGKKRTAKDKAEKAAKEKRQTDEFRENLLKDWDDDDDDEENGDNADDKDKDDNKTLGDKTFNSNSSDTSPAKDDTKKTPTKETSCFDFDDSEDGIKPEDTIIQFGRKIPRIFGDKKRKSDSDNLDDSETVVETKEEERDAVSEHTPMSELSNETESIEEKKAREEKEEKDKKAKEEFDMAFKALLEETVAPTIPDAFDSKRDEGECSVEENIVNSTSVVDEEIIPPDPHEEENQIKKSEEVVVDNLDASKCASVDENQHFLVKMSGEGATTSPDKEISESKSTICDASNVAHQLVENFEQGKETVSHVEEIVEQTTEIEEVVEFKVDETVEKAEANCTNSQLPKEEPADSSKCQAFLSNDFVDDCIVDNYCSIEQTVPVQQSPLKSSRTSKSKSESMLIETAEKPKKISNESKGAGLVQASDMQFIVVANEASNVVTTMSNIVSSSTTSVNNPYQDMDFDIDSMPVIIGDDMTQGEQLQESQVAPVLQTVETTVAPQVQQSPKRLPMIASKSPIKQVENKVVTVISSTGQISKMNRNELKQVHKIPANKKDPPVQQIKVPTTKDTKITKKILLSPTKPFNSPAAVKISASSSSPMGKLSVPSFVTQKGIVQNAAGSGPVLILQSAGPSGSASKSTIQKIPQVIQQAGGNKVLILTSPSGASGQKMLGTLTSPQKSITGTRFLTTKGSVVVGKGGKPCQKIVIDKTGAISQSSKSVIIDKASISAGSTLSKSSTAILTSSNDSIASLGSKFTLAGNSKGTTILASPTVSGNKGVILTPLSNKSTAVADNQKLRLIASKSNSPVSSATKTKVVLKTQPQARLLVPSVAMKNQQLKFMTNAAKTQPNSSSTILIHTNQGVLATSSFPGAIQKQTTTSKPQATLIATPKAHILQANNKAMLQLQNKKVIIPKKPASPNILQKSQRKPVQRVSKKNFLTEQASATSAQVIATPPAVTCAATAPTQDVLLLPSMKNMPVVSQGTILQGTTVDAEGRKSYVYLTVDEHGNYRPLETAPVLDFDMTSTSEQQIQQAPTSSETQLSTPSTQPPPQQTLYFDPGTTDLDNLLLAIDEAGNVVNISQQQAPVPQSSTVTSGSSSILGGHSGQDILAKALADTQVLQQEPTIIPDPATSSMLGCVFVESMPPTSSVAHNVLETSSTLNQTPIMTPLEVPSAVSSLQTLPPDFLKRDTVVDPSMPLLSEDSTVDSSSSNTKTNKTIFVSGDSSSSMLGQSPTTSLAFQLSIGADNNIIVSSSAAGNIGTSLAYMTQPSTSVTDTILSQTSNNIEYVHSEDVNAAGDGILDQTVEQQVVTDSAEVYPITASGVTFDMDDVHKKVTYTEECETMNSAAAAIPVSMSIDYQETGSAHVMGTKTDYGGVPFNVEETTMSVASGDYDLNISDSTKTLTPSVEAASDQQMTTVEKLSLDADKQR